MHGKFDCTGIGPRLKGTPSGGLRKKQPKRTLGQKTALTPSACNWRRKPQLLQKTDLANMANTNDDIAAEILTEIRDS